MALIAVRRALMCLVLAASSLFPALVRAQNADGFTSSGVYFSLQGGWAIMHDSEFSRFSTFYTVEPDAEATFDSGFTGSVSFGYYQSGLHPSLHARATELDAHKLLGWRIELEASQWINEFDSVQWNRIIKYGNYPTTGEIETTAYMLNLIAEIGKGGGYHLYVGVGAGAAHFTMENVRDVDGPLFSDSDTSFAFQFMIGIEAMMTERVGVSLGYKIFGSTVATYADPGQPEIGGDRVIMPVAISSFLVGVSYRF